MLLSPNSTLQLQRPAEERLGLGILALSLVQSRQVVHRPERLGMLLTQLVTADLSHLDKQRFSLGQTALSLEQDRQAAHGLERIGVALTQRVALRHKRLGVDHFG